MSPKIENDHRNAQGHLCGGGANFPAWHDLGGQLRRRLVTRTICRFPMNRNSQGLVRMRVLGYDPSLWGMDYGSVSEGVRRIERRMGREEDRASAPSRGRIIENSDPCRLCACPAISFLAFFSVDRKGLNPFFDLVLAGYNQIRDVGWDISLLKRVSQFQQAPLVASVEFTQVDSWVTRLSDKAKPLRECNHVNEFIGLHGYQDVCTYGSSIMDEMHFETAIFWCGLFVAEGLGVITRILHLY